MKTWWVFFVFVTATAFSDVAGQAITEAELVNNQLWLDYYSYWHASPTRQFYGDAGFRYEVTEGSWYSTHLRPSIRFSQGGQFEPRAGLGLFYRFYQATTDEFEVRPWQGLLIRWPMSKTPLLSHYFRLEERIQFLTQEGWQTSLALRLRYRLSTSIRLPIAASKTQFFVPLSAEIFGSIGSIDELFADRTRLMVGVGAKVRDEWVAELQLTFQTSRVGDGDRLTVTDRLIQFKLRRYFRSRDRTTSMSTDDQ